MCVCVWVGVFVCVLALCFVGHDSVVVVVVVASAIMRHQ